MRRDEACWLLTKIAQNEIVSSAIAQRCYQIRDKIVCIPNPSFQMISSIEGGIDTEIACNFLTLLSENNLVSDDVQCDLIELTRSIKAGHFKDCEEMIYRDRCKACPSYKGERR